MLSMSTLYMGNSRVNKPFNPWGSCKDDLALGVACAQKEGVDGKGPQRLSRGEPAAAD